MPKRSKGVGVYIALLAMLALIAVFVVGFPKEPQTLKYTEVISYFQQNQVREFTLDMSTGDLVIERMTGAEGRIEYKVPHVAYFLQTVEPYIYRYNEENPDDIIEGVYERAAELPAWVSMIPMLLLVGLMVLFWVVMMRQSRSGGGGVAGFGRAKARSATDGRRVTFADVAGADEEKEELVEVVDFLRAPGKFNALGARIPKGVLLVGPPGTGKTLLARAVAGEADVQFFSISGSDFVEMFVGVGASRVRDLFEQAKKNAPSVIFIDEIDAVGRQRGAGLGGGHDEREQTLNQLLVEMDGFSANTGVIVLAATNRRDILDPALLRPGRFDRQIMVGYPDVKGREEILRVHSKNKPLGPDVDLKNISRGTVGFTGADLENLMNESALLAARRNQKAITMREIEEATLKVMAGPEKKSHVVTEEDKKVTAYHEAGHAVAAYYCPTSYKVHHVTIIPRGPAGGFTLYRPDHDRQHVSRKFMYEEIVSTLGGRVAEQLVLDDIHTGASQDLKQATQTARDMVTRFGFSDAVGPVVYGSDQGQTFLGRDYGHTWDPSEKVSAEIDTAVRDLMEKGYAQCTKILTDHIDKLHLIAKRLLEKEKIDGDEFYRMMDQPSDPTPAPPEPPEPPKDRPDESGPSLGTGFSPGPLPQPQG